MELDGMKAGRVFAVRSMKSIVGEGVLRVMNRRVVVERSVRDVGLDRWG